MKKIVFCGSIRFLREMELWAQELKQAGFDTHTPSKSNASIKDLAQQHFIQIGSSDAVFIFNKDGYLGTSATMEFGYALSKEKPLWALHKNIDSAMANFIQGVCGTPTILISELKEHLM